MKKRYYSLLLVALVGLLSCTSQTEEPLPASDTETIRFGLSQSLSRADFEADPAGMLSLTWDEGDKVGISAARGEQPLGSNFSYAVSERFDEGRSALLAAVSNLYQYRWDGEGDYTFFAYYPYTGTQGAGVHYLTQVSLPATQQQAAAGDFSHLKSLWVMKSEPRHIVGKQQTVDLTFRGIYSIVELKLKLAAPDTKSRSIERVQLNAQTNPLAAPIANLTLTSSKEEEKQEPALIVNDGVNYVDVELGQPFTLSDTAEQSIWLLVVPGVHAAGEIGVQLATNDSYRLDLTIPEAVTFEPNKVYRKEVLIDPADFYYYRDPSAPAVTYFKPVRDMADLTDGEYIISFDFANSDVDYLLQVLPVTRNPIPMTFEAAQVAYFGDMGIQSIADGYVWNLKADGDNWAISAVGTNGKTYLLNGCNQAQGISIAETLTGHYASTREYSNIWTISVVDSGSWIMQPILAPARYMGVDLVNNQWRFPTVSTASDGSFVFYKKVTE